MSEPNLSMYIVSKKIEISTYFHNFARNISAMQSPKSNICISFKWADTAVWLSKADIFQVLVISKRLFHCVVFGYIIGYSHTVLEIN